MFTIKLENGYVTINVDNGQIGIGAKAEALVFGDIEGAERYAKNNNLDETEYEIEDL